MSEKCKPNSDNQPQPTSHPRPNLIGVFGSLAIRRKTSHHKKKVLTMNATQKPRTEFSKRLKQELVSWTLIILVVVFLRSTVFGMYEIPSGSMLPTIRIGDRIFANKLAYGLWIPFTKQQILSWNSPKRGDIVLFQSRTDTNTLIKRVVGVGGDVIEFRDGKLVINGKEQPEESNTTIEIPDETRFPVHAFSEELEGAGFRHSIFRAQSYSRTKLDRMVYRVPADHVFCMGDNRDDSNDSRTWGAVPSSEIYGKGVAYVYSARMQESSLWPIVRWERFFRWLS
jgi:signal peptidase I